MKYNPYILTALLQLVELAANPSPNTSIAVDQVSRILLLANSERAKFGVPPLTIDSTLNMLALKKSQDMVENKYFSHLSPTYGSAFNMMKSNGINYNCAGENLAIDSSADNAHTAWISSVEHRKNILNPNFIEIGIGIYAKDNGSNAYTQLFIG